MVASHAMRILNYFIIVSLCLISVSAARAEMGYTELLDTLTKDDLINSPTVSSDGHFISALVRGKDRLELAVWPSKRSFKARENLPYARSEIRWISWVGGGRLLLSLKEKGLVLYDAHIKRLRPLIDRGGPKPSELSPVLLSALPDDPTSILMQWEDPKVPGYPAVYRVNAVTGVSNKIISAWAPVVRWWASPEGEVKLGLGYKGKYHLLYNRAVAGEWQQLSKEDYLYGTPPWLLSVETGGATALVLSAHASDKRTLWRMNIATGEMLTRLAGHKAYDIDAALINPATDTAFGAVFTSERKQFFIWQGALQQEAITIAKMIDEVAVELISSSRDERLKIYRDYSMHRPSRYYLFNAEHNTVSVLSFDEQLNKLPGYLSETVFIPLEGVQQQMQAVLSRPSNQETGKAVVLIHGGPVSRSDNGYNYLVSWLTAHGYTVLQPNFRGSSGYGEKWRQAGYAEWGGDMQDDISTSIKWMFENGYSTPQQLCVMGGSYGGYASMMALVRGGKDIACGISLNGVMSLPLYRRQLSISRFGDLVLPRIIGDKSISNLRRISPLHRAGKVKQPILLMYGTRDTVVPPNHTRLLASILRKKNRNYELVAIQKAGHRLTQPENKRLYLQHVLRFLEENTVR